MGMISYASPRLRESFSVKMIVDTSVYKELISEKICGFVYPRNLFTMLSLDA